MYVSILHFSKWAITKLPLKNTSVILLIYIKLLQIDMAINSIVSISII